MGHIFHTLYVNLAEFCACAFSRFSGLKIDYPTPQLKPADMITTTSKTSTKNILLIEDNGEMCLLLNLILNDKNVHVEHVKNLSDAEAFLQKTQPDLVLLDNRLPDGFGLDFISYIKANYPAIKIIMISGVDKAAEDLALEAGAELFLSKPFSKAKLLESVRSLLN